MSEESHSVRAVPGRGRAKNAGRACLGLLLVNSLVACSAASSDSGANGWGGSPSGGDTRSRSGSSFDGGGPSSGGTSSPSKGSAGAASYSARSSGLSIGGAASGGMSASPASSNNSSAAGAAGKGDAGAGMSGASGSGAGGASSSRSSAAAGGSTGSAGGRGGGSGTAAGGSTSVPVQDGGITFDAGTRDAGAGGGCAFSGGEVTAALYPNGLTLKKACSPYLVSSINVFDNGVLAIEPGVTVNFRSGGALFVGVQGPGRLLASGNSSEPITFTAQEPAPGAWRGLVFGGGTAADSRLSYAQISAAGANRDGAIMGTSDLPAHVLSLDHLTIDRVGEGASGILALGENSSIAISNSTFVDSGHYPISVYAASFSSIGTGNTYPSGSAIEVMGGTLDTSVSWTNPGLPVAITSDLFVQGASNPLFSVGSGMNLRFGAGVALHVGRAATGKIAITGTSSARVTLTALASSPTPGSWAGLQIWDLGRATLSYTDVRYGGNNNGDSRGNVTVESSATTVQLAIDHGSLSDSLGWGLYVPCAASAQNAAIITVDSNTTYANNVLGSKGPGLTCNN